MSGTNSLLFRPIQNTPVAVIDFETTGLHAGPDRVVELSVVRVDPGQTPRLVLDTLVNPQRPMAATEVHGITHDDVVDAPTFQEIAGDVVRAIYGCAVAAYNIYFDISFLEFELRTSGLGCSPPHLCLMYMRPLLGLGGRCSLAAACEAHGIKLANAHQTSGDAFAAAQLWLDYLPRFRADGINEFGHLRERKSYKFMQSFERSLVTLPFGESMPGASRLKSRQGMSSANYSSGAAEAHVSRADLVHTYWDSLKAVLTDLEVTPEEMEHMASERVRLGLTLGEVRSLHARAFANVITQFIDDQVLDDREAKTLHRLHQCLDQLGWGPGNAL